MMRNLQKIAKATEFLEKNGYFVRNLWHIDDVKNQFHCSDEEALEVLEKSLTSDSTFDHIFWEIDYYGTEKSLIQKE